MDIKEKNDIFIDNTNLQGRMSVFHDKLRKHLSNEYLFLSEKKDNLENEILQLKMEKEQKDKTLFPNIGKKDVRKYFSPLNISEIDEDQKDEKEKQLLANISRISEEAEMLDGRMLEIKDFLQDIETMLDDDSKDSLSGFLLKKEKNRITVEDFYKKHNKIYLYQPGKTIKCTIYSVYDCLDKSATYNTDFSDDGNDNKWVDWLTMTVNNNAYYPIKKKPAEKDHIITLSTCSGKQKGDSYRFVVHSLVTDTVIYEE